MHPQVTTDLGRNPVVIVPLSFFFLWVLWQGLSVWPRLVWNSWYNPDKPSACYLPVSASRVLRFQACTSSMCFLPSIIQHSWLVCFQVGSPSSVLYPRVSSFKSEGNECKSSQNESRRLLIYDAFVFVWRQNPPVWPRLTSYWDLPTSASICSRNRCKTRVSFVEFGMDLKSESWSGRSDLSPACWGTVTSVQPAPSAKALRLAEGTVALDRKV